MKARSIIQTTVVLLLAILSGSISAVELKSTPIQDRMIQNISLNTHNSILSLSNQSGDEFQSANSQKVEGRKSIWKAGLYSALLPGLGEYYVGNRKKARVFFAVEAVAWISFATFQIYGNWKEEDYIDFAREYANANLENKNDEFRDWVGFYDDIDQFNGLGRVQDPDRQYLVDNEDNHWRWQSSAEQATYRHLKNRSREAFRRADFMIGLAVINRIVSVIDAVRDAGRANRTIQDSDFSLIGDINYKLEVNPLNQDKPLKLAFYTRF